MAISIQKFVCQIILFVFSALIGFVQPTSIKQDSPTQNLTQKANELVRAKKFDEAIELFHQVIAAKPNEVEPHVMLGMALISAGRALEALEEMKRATQIDSNSASAFLGLGNANIALRRLNEAIEAFSQSARINPDYLPAYLNLGIAYGETKRFEESVEANKQALRISPNHPSALNGIGIGYYRLGQHQLGIDYVKQAAKLDPNSANILTNLGNWYFELGRHEEAAEAQAQVIRLAPRFPNAYRLSAISNFILGRSEAVIKDASKGLELADWRGTNSQFLIIFLALSQRQLGLDDDAKTTLNFSIKRSDTKLWPYPVIRYLSNEINANALLETSNDNDKLTESHAYIALNLILNKKPNEAREHFQWIKENGNKKFIEYTIALNELQKIENSNLKIK